MVKDCGEMGWVKDCGMRGVKYMRRDRRVRNEVEEEAIVGRWREMVWGWGATRRGVATGAWTVR
jgi:hypothetical protein